MTTHTIPYAKLVDGILAAYALADIHEGDAFISNDPYRGGVSHTPDVAVATPVFVDGKLIAFCTSFGCPLLAKVPAPRETGSKAPP
ncbi:MAG: N-methylhydantoinase B/acetone carboxylase, alpha subunit [Rhodospirillales bacterium]|jgi:N-methylhydantoinase B|nr:N-methylhydantoinase B/acetone carboxylase, alpha subunit [Rhodospirillales bacterium]